MQLSNVSLTLLFILFYPEICKFSILKSLKHVNKMQKTTENQEFILTGLSYRLFLFDKFRMTVIHTVEQE